MWLQQHFHLVWYCMCFQYFFHRDVKVRRVKRYSKSHSDLIWHTNLFCLPKQLKASVAYLFVPFYLFCCMMLMRRLVFLQKESAVVQGTALKTLLLLGLASSCTGRESELGMFAKWSSVKLIILSDNESRVPQG